MEQFLVIFEIFKVVGKRDAVYFLGFVRLKTAKLDSAIYDKSKTIISSIKPSLQTTARTLAYLSRIFKLAFLSSILKMKKKQSSLMHNPFQKVFRFNLIFFTK